MEVGGSDTVSDGRARRDRGAGGRRRIATADCARRHRDGPATRTPVARGMPCDRDGTPASDAQGSGAGSAVSCGRTIGADDYDGHCGGSAYGGSGGSSGGSFSRVQ